MATNLSRKPLQVYLRPEQLDALRHQARQRHMPMAELVRQGIDHVLAEPVPDDDPLGDRSGIGKNGPSDHAERHDESGPLDDIIGMFNSGLGDLAARHDDYLAKWAREDHRS